ncbi:MAG: hypothetical protein LUI39_08365 [Lachnospiraceae bacterium]|nr:hypothetical protein [Lachnospiraceae bacterium]
MRKENERAGSSAPAGKKRVMKMRFHHWKVITVCLMLYDIKAASYSITRPRKEVSGFGSSAKPRKMRIYGIDKW